MDKADIYQAMTSVNGFKPYFKKGLESWASWLVFFKVLAGRKDLDAAEMAIFTEATGLTALPAERLEECYICAGRRSGKSTACAVLAVYYAIWGGWEKDLQGGEEAQIFIISPTLAQGEVILKYIKAILKTKPFRHIARREKRDSVELDGVTISIKPASWRSTRGWAAGLIIFEELAFFRNVTEAANSDIEIYTALAPSTTNIRNSLICGISTPFIRQGLLWQKAAAWGKPGPILFWRSPTWKMNLTTTEAALRKKYDALTPAEFDAEYGAREREDLEQYLAQELIDAAIVRGRSVILPSRNLKYVAFCDPSEGVKGGDSMTFAIAHLDAGRSVVDLVREFKPPFSPGFVIKEIVDHCQAYGIVKIIQDNHAIRWIDADFKPFGIMVEAAEFPKSEIYVRFAVLAGKRAVELPDNERLRAQLQGLQRFLGSGGLVKIDHLSGGHDDVVNAAAGACLLASVPPIERHIYFIRDDPNPGGWVRQFGT